MKILLKNLRLNMASVRKAYKIALNAPEKSALSLFLTDNYHLLEREYRAVQRSAVNVIYNHRTSSVTDLCRDMCMKGILPDESYILTFLLSQKITTRELRHLPFFIKTALFEFAAEGTAGILNPEKNSDELLINAVQSLRKLADTDFGKILYNVSGTERILCRDPALIYSHMDEKTKNKYREAVSEEAEKSGKSEEDTALEALEKAKESKKHIGFFLNVKKSSNKSKGTAILVTEAVLPLITGLIFSIIFKAWYLFIILWLPLWEAMKFITDIISSRITKPESLPKMEFDSGVPEDYTTVIAISSILPSAHEARNTIKHLTDLYLSNCKGSVSVCLLADLKSASIPVTPQDNADIEAMKRIITTLNKRYNNSFVFAVRPRIFSQTQNEYTGFERKRGAISALVKYITDDTNEFVCIHGNTELLRKSVYLMALDSDTEIPFDTLPELVSTAAHPLNKAVISLADGSVTDGYGIFAPKVETSIESAKSTLFSEIMSGSGGLPAYSSVTAEKYQDLFGKSIFSGKGLIDIHAFRKLLIDRLPNQKILSHDILEGSILRTAFVGNTALTDSYPSNTSSYFKRLHRWIRGDIQNAGFITESKNTPASLKLSNLSRWWLFDNIRRSITPVITAILIIFSVFASPKISALITTISILSVVLPDIVSCIISLINGGVSMVSRLYYSDAAPYALTCFLRAIFLFVMLIRNAWNNLDAIVRAVFRVTISKKNLLQWTTAAEAEKQHKTAHTLINSVPSVAAGLLLLFFGNNFSHFAGIFFIVYPVFALTSTIKRKNNTHHLSENEKNTIISYAASTWHFYEEFCTAKDNYLPPDNVQETPVYRIAHRTSPTNIGLMLSSFLAARDFDFISTKELYERLEKSFSTINKLKTCKGNLYNWYDTVTLEPMNPAYISTVDSGNYLCCLTALKEGLKEYVPECSSLKGIIKICEDTISECDLAFLYSKRRNLFHIGFDKNDGKLSDSYFDLLMSEARMTSYLAVSSGKVPKCHWSELGRMLSKDGRYTGPLSWTGTMFEYFMPAIFVPSVKNTLGSEALKFCIRCQKRRVQNMNVPYGISESGYYAFDANLNYQYKAHGVQKLGLKRNLDDELVISPYSSFLTLSEAPHDSIRNLRELDNLGLKGRCGFYEAADFTHERNDGQDFSVVRSYMAHHVGMSFLSAANGVFDNIMQKRFMSDDKTAGGRSLLYEKIPSDTKVYKGIEKHDAQTRPERIQQSRTELTGVTAANPNAKALSNGEWSHIASDTGLSVSLYRGLSVFSLHHEPITYPDGIFTAVRTKHGKILSFKDAPFYDGKGQMSAKFSNTSVVYKNRSSSFSLSETVIVYPRLPAEQHSLRIRNRTKQKKTAALCIYAEPSLLPLNSYDSHPAFSKMFIESKYIESENILVFSRRVRESDTPAYLSIGFLDNSDFTFSTDREEVLTKKDGLLSLFRAEDIKNSQSVDKCFLINIELTIQPRSTVSHTLAFACASSEEEAVSHIIRMRKDGACPEQKASLCPFDNQSITGIYAKKLIERMFFGKKLPDEVLKAAEKNRSGFDSLWQMGISGDFPVILSSVDSTFDMSCLAPLIKLHKKLNHMGIITELVLVGTKNDGYDGKLSSALRRAAEKENYSYNLGVRGGIFTLFAYSLTEKNLVMLVASSSVIYPEKADSTSSEKFILNSLLQSDKADLSHNCFSENGYLISNSPHLPWCQILCNKSFGTLISDNSLGYTWALNSRENKLTPWKNNTRSYFSGEILTVGLSDKTYDILKGSTCFFNNNLGQYLSNIRGLIIKTDVSVQGKNLSKEIAVSIVNQTDKEKEFTLSYFAEPVLCDSTKNKRYQVYNINTNNITVFSPVNKAFSGYAVFSCSDKNVEFSTDMLSFLSGGKCSGYENSCVIIRKKIILPPKRDYTTKFYLSFAKSEDASKKMPFIIPRKVNANKIEIDTPDKDLDYLFNNFLQNQIIGGRINGRCGFYQCSGAYGYRDQLQDAMSVVITHPEILKIQISRCASAQFKEGDVLHWFHPVFSKNHLILRGVRTLYSDDLLWLPLAVSEYCIKTGDFSILKTKLPYLDAPVLADGEKERFGEYPLSQSYGTLYEHCMRAIIHASVFGEHSLPLIKGGDWNDSFNEVGINMKGESVWLAMFLSYVMKKFSYICKISGDRESTDKLNIMTDDILQAVDEFAWDKDRYLRCFYDNSEPMGKDGSSECEIDILPQSWSVITGMPDISRQNKALDTAYSLLVDKDNNLIKLFTPPFTKDGVRAGYVNNYPKGIRENGGQYTHGAVWLCSAFFKAGKPDIGYELLNTLNPAKKDTDIYKTEPYYLAGDVYSAKGLEGRGGWSIYSGSAGWFYRTVYEDMLGLKLLGGKAEIKPCIPDSFQKSRVKLTIDSNTEEFIIE